MEKTGITKLLKVTNWWEKVKKAGKKHSRTKSDPTWFENTLENLKNTHLTLRKLRYFEFCKYTCIVLLVNLTKYFNVVREDLLGLRLKITDVFSIVELMALKTLRGM